MYCIYSFRIIKSVIINYKLNYIIYTQKNVRKAYNYKYLGGSLVDYILTKERLCLEAEKMEQ